MGSTGASVLKVLRDASASVGVVRGLRTRTWKAPGGLTARGPERPSYELWGLTRQACWTLLSSCKQQSKTINKGPQIGLGDG